MIRKQVLKRRLKFPDGATQINIYRVEYDITAESSDVDEESIF